MKQQPGQTTTRIGIFCAQSADRERSCRLAEKLGLHQVSDRHMAEFILSYRKNRLELSRPNDRNLTGPVYAEFVEGAAAYRRSRGGTELLLRAVGSTKKRPKDVLDATGGLGRDGFLLAAYGCTVTIAERNPIIFALLHDGLQRAMDNEITRTICERIRLIQADSLDLLMRAAEDRYEVEVIYLDPMFPVRGKTALVKKEMQMFQLLLGRDRGIESLFVQALQSAGSRVVVKRPKAAPPLDGPDPSHSLAGKTTRFDVYLTGLTRHPNAD